MIPSVFNIFVTPLSLLCCIRCREVMSAIFKSNDTRPQPKTLAKETRERPQELRDAWMVGVGRDPTCRFRRQTQHALSPHFPSRIRPGHRYSTTTRRAQNLHTFLRNTDYEQGRYDRVVRPRFFVVAGYIYIGL